MKPLLIFNKVWRGNCTGDGVSQMSFTARMVALQSLVERKQGVVLEVQDRSWNSARLARQLRPFSLMGRIRRERPDVIIVQYPNYPFFWDSERKVAIMRSMLFTRMLSRYCSSSNCRLVLDYRDVIDCGMSPVACAFERLVFSSPHDIWAPTPEVVTLNEIICERVGKELPGDCSDYPVYGKPTIILVPNGAFVVSDKTDNKLDVGHSSETKFVYAGDLRSGNRGIEQLIAVAAECSDLDCRFVLCGHNGSWITPLLENLKHVTYVGELPRTDTMALLGQCDVGLISHPPGMYDYSFPTKLAEYVCSGLAVLSTNTGFVSKFVTNNGIGISAPFDQWKESIRELCVNRDMLSRIKAASRAHSSSLSWDAIYDRAYSSLETRIHSEVVC